MSSDYSNPPQATTDAYGVPVNIIPGFNSYDGAPESKGLLDFWLILKVLRKWWWLIAVITASIMALTALLLFRMTPLYQASTIVEVKQVQRNITNVSEIDKVVVDLPFFTTQIELLKSASLIEDVVESLNLVNDPYFYNADDENWQSLPRKTKIRNVTGRFKESLKVSPIGRSRLIKLSFRHSDPKRAALIVNTVSETFINEAMSRKLNSTAYARTFLEERLGAVKVSLEDTEREFVKYASDNNLIVIKNDDGQEATGSLDSAALIVLNSELTAARTKRVAAEAAFNQANESTFASDIIASITISELNSKKVELSSEYSEKLLRFKPDYPTMIKLKSRIALLDAEVASQTNAIIDARRSEFKSDFDLAKWSEQDLRSRVAALKGSIISVREKSVDYNILKRQLETERAQYDALLQRLKEISVSDDIGSNLVQIVDPAQIPRAAFKPNISRTLFIVMILSSGLGFALSFAIEIIDDRVKGPEDVKNKLGLPIMGVIPVARKPAELLSNLEDPQSSVSESYASLRTNLKFSGPEGGPQVLQLTSTRSGEGKSVSSLGLALRFSGLNERVLLIDGDMRLPTFLQGDGETVGLSGVLTSRVDFGTQIQPTRFPNLDLLPSGQQVPNPSEILSSTRFDELIAYAREHYSHVIIDSPPVLGLADALVIGAKVDGTLIIVEAKRLRTPNVKASIERLNSGGTKILGAVLTKYKAVTTGYMDYYQYSYGQAASQYGDKNDDGEYENDTKSKGKQKFELM